MVSIISGDVKVDPFYVSIGCSFKVSFRMKYILGAEKGGFLAWWKVLFG